MSNKDVLDKGFAKGLAMIEKVLTDSLRQNCMDLLKQVALNREFIGFTGQTQTSYMGGLYINGKLMALFNERNWLARPRRGKVQFQQFVFLENPYEGVKRSQRGEVDIVDPSGVSLSTTILKEYKAPKNGFAIVITTGTEYSDLIELKGYDVLTKTFMDAPDIINKNWKKIGD